MFRLAHISDIHLGPLPDISYRELASKRVVGYVNWQRNRRKLITESTLGAIVADIERHPPDHLAVTGDLVNLALDAEIDFAKLWLETLGKPEDVSVVPGNHDAYVPGAFDKACRLWAPWMTGDGKSGPISRESFPYLRVRGNIALIGVTTARATAPFMANGFFRQPQGERLAKILDETARQKLFRVIMIHHPPIRSAVSSHKRLFGIGRFHTIVTRHGADLVLHGHSHMPSLHFMGEREKPIPVVGVCAAGQGFDGNTPPAQYNLFEIGGDHGDWYVKLTRRGFTVADAPISNVSVTDLTAWGREKPAIEKEPHTAQP